jgi:hypothetical protein
MRIRLFLLVAAALLMAACGNKEKGAGGEDAEVDSIANVQVERVLDGLAEPPMFVYYYRPQKIQMMYWTEADHPEVSPTEADEEWAEESIRSWQLQDRLRLNAEKYTHLLWNDTVTLNMKFVDEQVISPDSGRLDVGQLHNEWMMAAGLRYALDSHAKIRNGQGEDADEGAGMVVAVTDGYLATHKRLARSATELARSEACPTAELPADVVKQLEQQYGMRANRSKMVSKFGDRYVYGVLQFHPKDEKVTALEVITDGEAVYSYSVEGNYDEEDISVWNVDDEGEYFASNILAAFEGKDGPEFYFQRYAPESCTTGVMAVRNGRLLRETYASYYVNIDEGYRRQLWKTDIAKMVKLYEADNPEDSLNTLSKWTFVDIDGDGYDEVWLRDSLDHNGAFFSFPRDEEPQLICCETEHTSAALFDGRILISGPAGGASYFYANYLLKDSHLEHTLTIMEEYGEPMDCYYDGKEISKKECEELREQLPTKEHWMKEPLWQKTDD